MRGTKLIQRWAGQLCTISWFGKAEKDGTKVQHLDLGHVATKDSLRLKSC